MGILLRELPPTAQDIARCIGVEQTVKLLGSLPSCGKRPWRRSLYVPATMTPDHPLVAVLGWHDALRLSREFGGLILQPPSCVEIQRSRRNEAILFQLEKGLSVEVVAASFGVDPMTVRRVRRQITSQREARNDGAISAA